jgi:hypothetical protein
MQDAALEVESNILAVDKLRSKDDRDRRRGRSEASTSGSSTAHPQVDELAKLVKSLFAEVERLKLEGKQNYRNPIMLKIGVTSENQITPRRLSKEIKEAGIGTIRKSKTLSKITLLLMKKERKKRLILKSIVLETPPHFPIKPNLHTRSLSWKAN